MIRRWMVRRIAEFGIWLLELGPKEFDTPLTELEQQDIEKLKELARQAGA